MKRKTFPTLGVAFGRINLGRKHNDSRHTGELQDLGRASKKAVSGGNFPAVTRPSTNSPTFVQVSKNPPLVASASEGGLTLALGESCSTPRQ